MPITTPPLELQSEKLRILVPAPASPVRHINPNSTKHTQEKHYSLTEDLQLKYISQPKTRRSRTSYLVPASQDLQIAPDWAAIERIPGQGITTWPERIQLLRVEPWLTG